MQSAKIALITKSFCIGRNTNKKSFHIDVQAMLRAKEILICILLLLSAS